MTIMNQLSIIKKLNNTETPDDAELKMLLEPKDNASDSLLFESADRKRREVYGNKVYLRGLIEFTNYCRNNCYYCGIRCGNTALQRYRLSKEEILTCCKEGYALGCRTFVLQGGEDSYYSDDKICDIIHAIYELFPDCTITLSIGEKAKESYQAFFRAGARRYLLRHETADTTHYQFLHPEKMSLAHRIKCLYDLKEIGYQVGTGFMVGSPCQTIENIIKDIRFMQDLKPDMIGIGPYLRHTQTPFRDFPNGSLTLTLRLLAISRLMFPYSLIPATTALGAIHPKGREMGLKAGANVIMPNLTLPDVRALYDLYENISAVPFIVKPLKL